MVRKEKGANISWHSVTDVVVAGYGAAGAAAAITAHDAGSKVILLEKMGYPGGMTGISGGVTRIADDAQKAADYLKRTNMNTTPDDVIYALANGMTKLSKYFEKLAQVDGAVLDIRHERGASYPFPGAETFGLLLVKEIPNFSGYTWMHGTKLGERLHKLVCDNVGSRDIDVWFSTAAKRLITNSSNEVLGIMVDRKGELLNVKARRAVILSCGGFEHNEDLKLQYFEAQPVYSPAPLGNTGDGIMMAQKVGAALWHMWHFHGSYGFKYPEIPVAFRHSFVGPRVKGRKMPWILVDKFGRRFMNENPSATQDVGARPLEFYDANIQDFHRIPCYLIFDERGRLKGPLAKPVWTDESYRYDWSENNSKEIEKGWIDKAISIPELAVKLGIDSSTLVLTIKRWNDNCGAGTDKDFGRPPDGMMSVSEPPFYAMKAWPIASNTQGGPVHNARQQILDPFGKPILRLYSAGELGSLFGHLYLLSGNFAECFVTGQIAGSEAASEEPR